MSDNRIGDKGAEKLASVISGRENSDSSPLPPLKYIDISNCSLKSEGCGKVMNAMVCKSFWRYLDLSGNSIGFDNFYFFEKIALLKVKELVLSSCQLKTKGACSILDLLVRENALRSNLRFLSLNDNEICDSVVDSLCRMLEINVDLEYLDLGFNKISNLHSKEYKKAIAVKSNSKIERKLYELTVNLVGNPCDPYLLDTPGMTRAKSNFLFGIQQNINDPLNSGYTHIPYRARGGFLARKKMDDIYRASNPTYVINNIR